MPDMPIGVKIFPKLCLKLAMSVLDIGHVSHDYQILYSLTIVTLKPLVSSNVLSKLALLAIFVTYLFKLLPHISLPV